jgi:hypothetical protein
MQEDYFPASDVYSREGFAESGNIRTVSANGGCLAMDRAQEAAGESCFSSPVAYGCGGLGAGCRHHGCPAGSSAGCTADLLGLQQIQFDQLVMQQMQVAGGRHEQVPRQYSSVE